MKRAGLVLLGIVLGWLFCQVPFSLGDQIVIVNGLPYLVQSTEIDFATAADHTLAAAPSDANLRTVVLGLVFVCSGGANTITFENLADDSDITGGMAFPANGGLAWWCGIDGCFHTAAGSGLEMELSAATSVDGTVRWVQIP